MAQVHKTARRNFDIRRCSSGFLHFFKAKYFVLSICNVKVMALRIEESELPMLCKVVSPQVLVDYCAATTTSLEQLKSIEEKLAYTNDPVQRAMIAACLLKVSSKNLRQWPYLMKAEVLAEGERRITAPPQPTVNAVPQIRKKASQYNNPQFLRWVLEFFHPRENFHARMGEHMSAIEVV